MVVSVNFASQIWHGFSSVYVHQLLGNEVELSTLIEKFNLPIQPVRIMGGGGKGKAVPMLN
jgi:hypothetical protein